MFTLCYPFRPWRGSQMIVDGILQRERAARLVAFASRGPNMLTLGETIDSLYASTLIRTQETAAPLSDPLDLPVTILDGLREVAAGNLEMLNDPTSQGIYNATAFAWARGDLDVRTGPAGASSGRAAPASTPSAPAMARAKTST